MRISYSRYSAFLANPERYRMYYILGLVPEGDNVPSYMNYGRRRGSCFHEIQEARAKSVRDSEITGHKWDQAVYDRCVRLVDVIPPLDVVLSEKSFEFPIGDGKHSITGRLDHVFNRDGVRVGDFKTTKGTRTKKELSAYFGELETSPQAHFYLHAAAELGYATDQFTYHVLLDHKDKTPQYIPLDLTIGAGEVRRKMQAVYAACEGIEFYSSQVGKDKPWPHSNNWPCCGDRAFCGYQEICGRTMPPGCVPPGFTCRMPELLETEESA